MSDPSWAWMSVARSGVRRWEEPSRCELNLAPSSLDRASRRETEDLVAAAVSEDRLRPADKPVETAASRDEIVAGPQVQMIGIAQEYRRAGGVADRDA